MRELSVEFTRLMEQRKNETENDADWLTEIAVLYANYEPLELAKLLKAVPMDAIQIAHALKRAEVSEKAVAIGTLILHPDIYPDTSEQAMHNILHEVFPEENIDKAIGILYPVRVIVLANTVWNDTGIDIFEDEIVTVTYCGGRWSINPAEGFSDASGITVIGKPGYTLPGQREGCLAGKIGNSEAFYIGKQSALPCGAGRLFLGANDDVDGRYGVGFRDNFGSIEVRINKKLR